MKRRVIYVITDNRAGRQYFPFETHSDFTLFAHCCDVLPRLARAEEWEAVFKVAASVDRADDPYRLNPVLHWLRAQAFADRIIVSRRPFRDELAHADAVVIDYPSTTLVEAACYPATMLVYNDPAFMHLEHCAEASAALRQAGYVGDTWPGFLQLLDDYLAGKLPDKPDKDPLRSLFGAHQGGGETATAAAARVIVGILAKGRLA